MKTLNEVYMIHALKAVGLSITAIARYLSCDRKTVRKYLERVELELRFCRLGDAW